MDNTLAEAHAVLAFNLFWYEWAWTAAEEHFNLALNLDPNSADTHWMYAHLRSNQGRHQEALAAAARARELDPLSTLINAVEGQCLLHAGRNDEAITRLQNALDIDSRSRTAHLFTANAYIEKGCFAEAVAEAAAARELSRSNTQALAVEAYAIAQLGRPDHAREMLQGLLRLSTERYVPPYNIALACISHKSSSEKPSSLA